MEVRSIGAFVAGIFMSIVVVEANAHDFLIGSAPAPTCGKVCKLVCESKKLSAVCYACECDQICLPGPSRPGCKYCATCYGEPTGDECSAGCQGHAPACEFCWRDWIACGCAKPRTVKVLTKYEAEKAIAWYRWEVVDAACCGCVAEGGQRRDRRCIYKPAPAEAELGDIYAVTDDEWTELAAVLMPNDADVRLLAEAPTADSGDDSSVPAPKTERLSIAERLGRLFTR